MSTQGKRRVAILFGGRSAEHEVSLISAGFVVASLDPERYEPLLIGIDKQGRFLLQDQAVLTEAAHDLTHARLDPNAPEVTLRPHPTGSEGALLQITDRPPVLIDVAFPVLHGPFGEDGCVQGLLELVSVPYVGTGVLGSAVGMDKDVMKRLLAAAGIPVVPWVTISRSAYDRAPSAAIASAKELGLPIFVKPANLGSSVGIRRAKTAEELVAAVEYAFEYDTKIVLEKALPQPREIECAVLGNEDPIASVPGEIAVHHPDGFYSYAAKYLDKNGADLAIPADLPPADKSRIAALAVETFRVLEGAGLARVDFFLDAEGGLYVNEINTLPGMTPISMYPKLFEASGIPPRELVSRLIDLAVQRRQKRAQLRVSA